MKQFSKKKLPYVETYKGHTISTAADKITHVLNEEPLSPELRKRLLDIRKLLIEDTIICIPWSADDVLSLAQQNGKKLSKRKAKELLHSMYYHHDATVGINWDVIYDTIFN